MKKTALFLLMLFLVLSCFGCGSNDFKSIGPFTVQKLDNDVVLARDGIGRRFLLVPRGQTPPEDTRGATVIYTPVKRVVAFSTCDVSFLVGFGILQQVLVGVTKEKNEWTHDSIREAMDEGKIVYLGDSSQINFELMKAVQPDVVFTWNADIVPMLEDLKIPAIITNTETAKGLEIQAEYVRFVAPFFQKESEGNVFADKFLKAIDQIKERSAAVRQKPSVIWGDVYNKRVLVEPNNAWVSQLVGLSGGKYELDDVQGASCLEITLERFFLAGKKADVMFTYRSPKTGINTKKQLAIENPMMADIKPMLSGQMYTPKEVFYDSYHRLDEVMMEVASILQPEVFGEPRYEFFMRLQ